MDKFLLASNPMREGSGEWIIQMITPVATIRCFPGHGQIIDPDREKHYQYMQENDKPAQWTLSVHFIEDPKADCVHILDRAWRWFRSYLQHQTSTQ